MLLHKEGLTASQDGLSFPPWFGSSVLSHSKCEVLNLSSVLPEKGKIACGFVLKTVPSFKHCT